MSDGELRAYLATALTGLSEVDRAEVFSYSERIGQVCARCGYSLYQPREFTDPVTHADKAPREVYLTDRERVATSDLIIALCTQPSYGVGAENEIASSAGVPVIYLAKKGTNLSKMLSGSLGENRLVEYVDATDLDHQLSALLEEFQPSLVQRRSKYSGFDGRALATRLRDLRERTGLTIDQLAAKIAISSARLEALETQDEKVTLPTLEQIRRLSGELGAPASYLMGESPLPKDATAYQSLQNLKAFARTKRLLYPIYEALREEYLWWRKTIGFAAAARDAIVLTEEDWAKRYEEFLDHGNQQNLDLWE